MTSAVRYNGKIESYDPDALPYAALGYISGFQDKQCLYGRSSFLDWDGDPIGFVPQVGQRVTFFATYSPSTGRFIADEILRDSV
ncbi:hypothetical protein ACI77F_16000 [Pseudomonas tritici]|uniref:hypothetical protein n=1 Tax=Pseudomonas tritici TaxID=2745518 RepID=UPI00387B5AD6